MEEGSPSASRGPDDEAGGPDEHGGALADPDHRRWVHFDFRPAARWSRANRKAEGLAATRSILGVLGGIGSGKSFVARRAAALGPGTVVDADAIAHEALRTFAGDGRLAEAVGPEFVTADGKPDVKALGDRAFADAALLRRLERLVHPACQASITASIDDHREGQGPPLLVLDVPLLIEVGLDRRCDALWYVDVPDDLRAERAGQRGLTLEQLQRREAFQSPRERKRARADLVIHNDVDDEALDRQIIAGLEALGVRDPAPKAGGNERKVDRASS